MKTTHGTEKKGLNNESVIRAELNYIKNSGLGDRTWIILRVNRS